MSNPITLEGNLAADPELRFTAGGDAIASFTVMTSRSVLDKTTNTWDNNVDVTGWRCTAWRQVAENVCESLQKGDAVIVTGYAASRSWEDREGNKRSSIEVTVKNVGPSLTRATAKVSRISRTAEARADAPARRSSGPAANDPWATGDTEPPF